MINFPSKKIIVSAAQMQGIEERIFKAGMPVSALMEKAAGLCFQRIHHLYPQDKFSHIGVLVGPGHNGGDALVIARELHLTGYRVKICRPLNQLKQLTASHAQYAISLGIPLSEDIQFLQECEVIIDGLFGFGLTRNLSGKLAEAVDLLNSWRKLVVSIDIPSGIHTDTGEILGTAVKATQTLCLGLWKRAFFQDQALEYMGEVEKLDFGIPLADIEAIIANQTAIYSLTSSLVKQFLPLPRPLVTHKYQQGHLLLICGSRRYAGAAILTALGARGSGVGMLSIAVPQSLKSLLVSQVPEALIVECEETPSGAIASLPFSTTELAKFNAIACGCGLTPDAKKIVQEILTVNCPLVLDADALNILGELWGQETSALHHNGMVKGVRILTPHPGEFKRLFPDISLEKGDRLSAVRQASQQSNHIILLKGARTAIANPQGKTWVIPNSTPALARGGSGDVLTGLIGGLIAQNPQENQLLDIVATAAWLHAHAGILAAQERTELGVDGSTLAQYLTRVCSRG